MLVKVELAGVDLRPEYNVALNGTSSATWNMMCTLIEVRRSSQYACKAILLSMVYGPVEQMSSFFIGQSVQKFFRFKRT